MAGEIQVRFATGKTVYVLVWDRFGKVWNGSAFVTYVTANLGTYAIATVEQGAASGKYNGTFPSVAAGIYGVEAFNRSGGAPAETDSLVGIQEEFGWGGQEVVGWASSVIRSGTAQSGGATNIQLDAGASAVDNFYANGSLVIICDGAGAGQVRPIYQYVGANKTVIIHPNYPWAVNPDVTSKFMIVPPGSVIANGGYVDQALQVTNPNPSAAAIADKILDRNLAGGSDGGRNVRGALRASRNKVAFNVPVVGQFTVFQEDDVTPDWTGSYTAAAGNPVTVIDPA